MRAEVVATYGTRHMFYLDDQCGLVSHYKDHTLYDSQLEESFAERFAKVDTPWKMERETEIINLKDTVFIPDFAFRHPDGRTGLLEIVGFWRPEYLSKKIAKIRRANRSDLVIAVSETLRVSDTTLSDLPGYGFFCCLGIHLDAALFYLLFQRLDLFLQGRNRLLLFLDHFG